MRRETITRRRLPELPHLDWQEKAREAVGLGFICLAAYAFLSLASFDPRDSATIEWNPARAIAYNMGGRLGASIAESLLGAFGITSYVALVLLAFWGVMILLRRSYKDAAAKAIGVGLLQAACAALATLETTPAFVQSEFARGALLRSMGGSYGEICRDLLVNYFGIVGSYLVLLLLLTASCLLATDWLVYCALLRVWRLLQKLWVVGRSVVGAGIETVNALRRAQAMESLVVAGAPGLGLDLGNTRMIGPRQLHLQPIGTARRRGPAAPFLPEAEAGADFAGEARSMPAATTTAPPPASRGPQGTRVVESVSAYEDSFWANGDDGPPAPPQTSSTSAALAGAAAGLGSDTVRDPLPPPPRIVGESKTEVDRGFGGGARRDSRRIAAERAERSAPAAEPPPQVPSAEERDAAIAAAMRARDEANATADSGAATDAATGVSAGPAAASTPGTESASSDEAQETASASEPGEAVAESVRPAAGRTARRSKAAASKADAAPTAPAAAAETAAPASRPLPPIDLLEEVRPVHDSDIEAEARSYIEIIESTLKTFGIEAPVVSFDRGPVITRYELVLPAGVRVAKIIGLADDLTVKLKVPSVRIVYPIPGKNTIGLEVPNLIRETVRLKELMDANMADGDRMGIPLFFGKDATGLPLVRDLAEMPHLLVSGTTGAGKSVCLNTLIMSLLLTRSPEQLKLILIDPKTTELTSFRDVPHLMAPVVTEMKRAVVVLEWAIRQMEERYDLFSRVGVKKISDFNALGASKIRSRLAEPGEEPPDVPCAMPYLVVIVDELADLMMVAGKEVEQAVTRIAQKARAAGIHLVLATQRPSVDVITGLIKANMPARVAFRVASKIDSRTILDRNGAERLLGKGDMLVLLNGASEPIRAQCTYVSDQEINQVVEHLKEYGPPVFDPELTGLSDATFDMEPVDDPLFEKAVQLTLRSGRGSVSLLQRSLEVGFSRAGRLMDLMEKAGVVGEAKGSKPREVLLTGEQWEGLRASRGGGGGPGGGSDTDVRIGD
ncbi:MAG: DNA translocase FtsK 4TM domain-containing protein [Planctomycetes bacterium]|nr:DNA translocase FtsK 4TM domain-containing protein [Planctomycetota bacterium]